MKTYALTLGLVVATHFCGYLWWRSFPRAGTARHTADGVQVIEMLVRKGYHPARVRVRVGWPVRLIIKRNEDDPSSAGIYFTEPPLWRRLPAFATTVIAFTPEKTGDHLFASEEGRYRGHLIVEPPVRSRTSAEGGAPGTRKFISDWSHRILSRMRDGGGDRRTTCASSNQMRRAAR